MFWKMTSLIFVFNVESDLISQIHDFTKKVIEMKNQCELCNLTFDKKGLKEKWQAFIFSYPYGIKFMNKDNFLDEYFIQENFPAIFIKENLEINLLVSADEIKKVNNLNQLIALIKRKIHENAK